ncbi:hypothetical protein MP228_010809 [Amoeboaphelidium protococcarum]|nr:hypothetical protein MP228_010809 [Amoeboaphelidium protococcarum]
MPRWTPPKEERSVYFQNSSSSSSVLVDDTPKVESDMHTKSNGAATPIMPKGGSSQVVDMTASSPPPPLSKNNLKNQELLLHQIHSSDFYSNNKSINSATVRSKNPLPLPLPLPSSPAVAKTNVSTSVLQRKRVISDSEDESGDDDVVITGYTTTDGNAEVLKKQRVDRMESITDYDDQLQHSIDEPDNAGDIVQFFNSASQDELQDLASCSAGQVKSVISLRPFASFADLYVKFDQQKGLKTYIIDNYREVLQCFEVMDMVVGRCSSISQLINAQFHHISPDGLHADFDNLKSDQLKNLIDYQPSAINKALQLKNYQLVGLNWLRILFENKLSGILADEMGLGKTAMVISFIAYLLKSSSSHALGSSSSSFDSDNDGNFKFLIIVPSSTLENWTREFRKWCPSIRVLVYQGSQAERNDLRISTSVLDFTVLVTTYNMLGTSEDRGYLRKIPWTYMVLDEGHLIKNIQSMRYKNLVSIKSQYKLLLTGTPIQNTLHELLALLVFIMPDLFADAEEELRRLFSLKKDTKVSQQRAEKARVMLEPFILKRRKAQVLTDLPRKTEVLLELAMTSEHSGLYQQVIKSSQAETSAANNASSSSKQLYNILMNLRKVALHPLLASGGDYSLYYPRQTRILIAQALYRKTEYYEWSANTKKTNQQKEDEAIADVLAMMDYQIAHLCADFNALKKYRLEQRCWFDCVKVDALLQLINHHCGLEIDYSQRISSPNQTLQLTQSKYQHEKMLVFSQFVIMLDIIEYVLTLCQVKYVRLDGQTPVNERQQAIDAFDSDQDIRVFLLSTKAGGVGLNLIAASVVVLYDLDFNPFNDAQAQDRAYRIGQTRDITVYKLVTKATIEERIYQLAQRKITLEQTISASHSGKNGAQHAHANDSTRNDDDNIDADLAKELLSDILPTSS